MHEVFVCSAPCDRLHDICLHSCQYVAGKRFSYNLLQIHLKWSYVRWLCPYPSLLKILTSIYHRKPTCGEDCGVCLIKLNNILLPCGHSKNNVDCFETRDTPSIRCRVIVQKVVQGCNHTVNVECSTDVTQPSFVCSSNCLQLLDCGHYCPGSCGKCKFTDQEGEEVVRHLKCDKICGRK